MGSTGIIRTHGGHSLIGGGLSGITSSSGEREKDINNKVTGESTCIYNP